MLLYGVWRHTSPKHQAHRHFIAAVHFVPNWELVVVGVGSVLRVPVGGGGTRISTRGRERENEMVSHSIHMTTVHTIITGKVVPCLIKSISCIRPTTIARRNRKRSKCQREQQDALYISLDESSDKHYDIIFSFFLSLSV